MSVTARRPPVTYRARCQVGGVSSLVVDTRDRDDFIATTVNCETTFDRRRGGGRAR
jgi:hypothetical protein